MHKLFHVVTKAAIFNDDKSKVLVIDIDQMGSWGLPGGHIEEDEEMNVTMRRELFEECGVEAKYLRNFNFFFHSSGKIVLGYVGALKCDDIVSRQNNAEGIPRWLTREEFENITIEPNYRKLVIDNWE